jgi:predicted Zn-dependent protease
VGLRPRLAPRFSPRTMGKRLFSKRIFKNAILELCPDVTQVLA